MNVERLWGKSYVPDKKQLSYPLVIHQAEVIDTFNLFYRWVA
jgi:hypothetical protein